MHVFMCQITVLDHSKKNKYESVQSPTLHFSRSLFINVLLPVDIHLEYQVAEDFKYVHNCFVIKLFFSDVAMNLSITLGEVRSLDIGINMHQ